MIVRHMNNTGACAKCDQIFDVYPGFDLSLRSWFAGARVVVPDAHISCAGRGKIEQEAAFSKHTSRAHYGRSAHNYNAAIDVFQMTADGGYALNLDWFDSLFAKHPLGDMFVWYGAPHSKFDEMPHIEVKNWFDLVVPHALRLVEP